MLWLCTYQFKARGKGGRSGNPREFDCGVYPQVGDFDRTSSISSFNFIEYKRSKPFVSANFENSFSPGGGDFDNVF